MVAITPLPPALSAAPGRMAVLRLAAAAEGPETVIVAGPLPRRGGAQDRFAVAGLQDGETTTLWAAAPGSAAVGRADLVATADGRALLLLPRRAIVRLDPHAPAAEDRARLVARGPSLPVRVFAGGAGQDPVAVTLRAGGEVLLDRLDGGGRAHGRRAGPQLQPGQAPSLVMPDAEGRLLFGADDPVRGFQIWREGPEGWAHLVGDGAARFGQNAAILDAALWRGEVVLAVGPSGTVRDNLLGMPIRGELVTIGPDGRIGMIAGELRPSPAGLLVPRIGAPALRELAAEGFPRLAVQGDDLVAAVARDGDTVLWRFAQGGANGPVAELPGVPLALSVGADGRIGALVVMPEPPVRAEEDEDEAEEPDDDDFAAFAAALGMRT